MSDLNLWDKIAGTPEEASMYMTTYGEGVGFDTRTFIGALINDGESVLDVGCGPGHNYEHFLTFGPDVSLYKGTDYSSVMIAGCKLKYPDANFEVGDVRHIEEPDGSWDVVIVQDCLEHTNGYEGPVHEALRVAKKRVIISFWHLTENDDHINEDGDDGWGAWYSKPKWEAFLDSLDIMWIHDRIEPEGRNHPWDFYIIDKEEPR